ncbi:MAG TPA: hypothetical protein VFW83_04690, partial [Bryobacteraceae bacterium]|nr:hypothetical protein [Bryobacteraceae bacterium]
AIALFACLCWINCLAIEQWEGDGWKKARGLRAYIGGHIGAAAACVAIVAILALVWQRPVLAAAEAASALAFTRLDRIRLRLSPDALRVLADAALLSPILFLPFIGIRL